MPLLETRGAGSARGFGLTAAAAAPVFIEDVFSTTLYAGTNSYRAVDVGVADLATKGALFWAKGRSADIFTENHKLYDTARAGGGGGGTLTCNPSLSTNDSAINNSGTSVTFNPTGTSLILNGSGEPNNSNVNYVGWLFRKQPKFFDIVTYVGDGSVTRAIPHNLASVPGALIYKSSSSTDNWVYINNIGDWTSTPPYTYNPLFLNNTNAALGFDQSYSLGADSSVFYARSNTNVSGVTYVVYLFAHNAGGFGLTGTDNVISCGSYTGTGSAQNISLGWEPQFVLIKNASATSNWLMLDTMRGFTEGNADQKAILNANTASSQFFASNIISITSTGFRTQGWHASGERYVYIAIRRGPMRAPTTGTSVFTPITKSGDAPTATLSEIGFQFDAVFNSPVAGTYAASTYSNRLSSRLTGLGSSQSPAMETSTSISEVLWSYTRWNGALFSVGNGWASSKFIWYFLRRAPSFFDVVCWLGTGTPSLVLSHNLGVIPELIIIKQRNSGSSWFTATLNNGVVDRTLALNFSNASGMSQAVSGATATTFTAIDASFGNPSNTLVMAYLFASCPGVSKVGSYTGNGSSQTIDCGFTGGARFFLVKRTNATGDWWVYDSARGITAPADPAFALNSTAAEVTSADAVDPTSAGIIVNQEATCNINVNGGAYIFLAIA